MKRIIITAIAAAMVPAAACAQDVVRAGSTVAKPGPAANFTGRVTVRALTGPTAPGRAGAGLVHFRQKSRSNWHTHPAGQILYVVEGCGWTQVEGGPVARICKGDTVYAEPGVKHWHGATATSAMDQLAVTETVDGRNVDWLEPVSDAQYHGPG